MKRKKRLDFLKSFLLSVTGFALIAVLIIGIGTADNAFRSTQGIEPLNKLFFNRNNYILCFNYLGSESDIDLSALKEDGLFDSPAEPLVFGTNVIIAYIRDMASDFFETLTGG